MVSQPPLLEVIDLCFTHVGQTQPTIVDVNLQLYAGELVVIAGATGSGKSTLLNCITGISPAHTGGTLSGKVLYQGVEINHWSIRRRSQHFCILLQNVENQIFTDRVWDELVFGLENWNLNPQQIPQLATKTLTEFGLEPQRDWAINQLSAGQKQRLLLACLLAIGQPILLLDEPFAYLDHKGSQRLLQLLQTRICQGQSVLLIEHRLELVQELCSAPSSGLHHRTYRFKDGKLLPATGDSLSIKGYEPGVDASPKCPINQPGKPTLRTQNLSWGGYPAFPDLSVAAGETILLQGDNGCGKTTLLRLLSGLLKPTTGSIELLGQEITHWRVVQIARVVGFVLQNPNHQLFADSVLAEIRQPGVQPAIADFLLTQLNLTPQADRHPHSLSQGQKRRLALGAVLARQPQICLLDEIMVGQDPSSLALMLNVLRDFTRQGGTLILTSHDPIVAHSLQARIVLIGE